MSLFCLSEPVVAFEFAFGDGGAEFLASPLVPQDFDAVEVVLDEAAFGDDADGVPLSRRIGLPVLCRQEIIQVGQCVRPLYLGVGIEELVFEAKLFPGIGEVLYAAIDAFPVGVESVVEPEIEIAVLLFRDDAAGDVLGALVLSWVVDRAVADCPGGVDDFVVIGYAFEILLDALQCSVEEKDESLGDFLLCESIGPCLRSGRAAGACTARRDNQYGEDDRVRTQIEVSRVQNLRSKLP